MQQQQQGPNSKAERLSFSLTRQLAPQDPAVARQLLAAAPPSSAHDASSSTAQQTPHSQQRSVLDNSIVYLGETCMFDVVLFNAGAPVTALTLKIEASIEGGSSAVLHDNAAVPLPTLLHQGQHSVRVSTDVKEQGQLTVVASAVFTDPTGERKYHVQFFKFSAASPVSVRTRVRHLPHVCSGGQQQHVGGQTASTRCFLEANVQNSTQLRMLLHAVRLLAAPGVHAALLGGASAPLQQSPDQQTSGSAARDKPAAAAAHSDVSSQPDIDSPATPADTSDAPSAQQQQQQQQQQPGEAVLLLAGSSHNTLWQIDHHILGCSRDSSSAGGDGGAAAGGSPASTLGRLELHWSTCDARTGRLLTQPLSGPVPASGKDVLMQLSRLWTSSSSNTALDSVPDAQQQQQQQQQTLLHTGQPDGVAAFSRYVPVNQVFRAQFRLTAGQHSVGPLLLLYSAALPGGPTSSTGGAAGVGGQQAALTDSSSIHQQAPGPAGGAAACFGDEVVVQGGRSVRVPGLTAGQSVEVSFELLPLRPGWLRLPTFVVASEADGRLLDGVHDVHVLAV